jgi:hypothetical protein
MTVPVETSIRSALGAEISGVTEVSDNAELAEAPEVSDNAELAEAPEVSDNAGLAEAPEVSDNAEFAEAPEVSDKTEYSCTGKWMVLLAEPNARFRLTRSETRSFNGYASHEKIICYNIVWKENFMQADL